MRFKSKRVSIKRCRTCNKVLSDLNWFKSNQKRGEKICKKCLSKIKKANYVPRQRKPAVPRINISVLKYTLKDGTKKESIGYQVRHGQRHIARRGTLAGAEIALNKYKQSINGQA